jgi:hypothetical protein
MDFYVTSTHATTANRLYRNDVVHSNDYIVVRPVGGTAATPVLNQHGAQVRLYEAGTTTLVALRTVDGGGHQFAQNAYEARFQGLGTSTPYDIEVWFPTGSTTATKATLPSLGAVVPSGLAADRLVVVVRPRTFLCLCLFACVCFNVWVVTLSSLVMPLSLLSACLFLCLIAVSFSLCVFFQSSQT